MLKCSPEAFAKCPTRELCGSIQDATFTEDSECARFNQSVDARRFTNADRIRAMSDAELANFFADKCLMASYLQLTDAKYNLTATEIEAQKHTAFCILMKWLRQPAEEHYDS